MEGLIHGGAVFALRLVCDIIICRLCDTQNVAHPQDALGPSYFQCQRSFVPWYKVESSLLVCQVSLCHVMMAEGINSFAYKYCLSSLAATVAETGINSVGCHIFKRQVRILTWHISHDII